MRLTLFCAHSDLVTHLTEEVEFWRREFAHERARAEQAINELLRKANATPLTVAPPPAPPPTAEERELRELMRHPEFTGAGSVE